ncbi:MAG: hypothetical protein HYR76_11830 [Ignavibacteria bacterium]|nr:hypothetical protein [Ignavibacteria bacterium]MBI3765731.1 hypothetical protein [Ignavibacteriales bacterium]
MPKSFTKKFLLMICLFTIGLAQAQKQTEKLIPAFSLNPNDLELSRLAQPTQYKANSPCGSSLNFREGRNGYASASPSLSLREGERGLPAVEPEAHPPLADFLAGDEFQRVFDSILDLHSPSDYYV